MAVGLGASAFCGVLVGGRQAPRCLPWFFAEWPLWGQLTHGGSLPEGQQEGENLWSKSASKMESYRI